MNIEKLKNLTDEAHDIERIIIKIGQLGSNEFLHINIKVSNFYDINDLDTIQTDKDKTLELSLLDYYNIQLDKIKDEIKKLVKEG